MNETNFQHLSLRELLALWLCKSARWFLRLTKHGGTNLPGKIAVKVCPTLPAKLSQGVYVICVSGTNGKTTTCRMIEEGFHRAGKRYFANRSGANLMAGITAEFAAHSTLSGRSRCDFAIIECDEIAAKKVFELLDPKIIAVTNLFRDQLDRCGEVSNTLSALQCAVSRSMHAILCLNADDSLVTSISEKAEREVRFFGMDAPFGDSESTELSDAKYCIRCRTLYEYDYVTYGHLGAYRCPNCGYHRPETVVSARYISGDDKGSEVKLTLQGNVHQAYIPIPAAYNVYNALAACTVLDAAGFTAEEIISSLHESHCGFGRMEQFDLGPCHVQMMLVKNPAGCNQVLHYLKGLGEASAMVLCLNDNPADGTDISWIWDADFECLAGVDIPAVYLSGERAEELLLRLKHAGVDVKNAVLTHEYPKILEMLKERGGNAVIVPTYTAMMELRPLLVKATSGKAFWE